jgi:hypothetical protein
MSGKTMIMGALVAMALSACSSHAIKYSTGKPAGGPVHQETEAFFLWGLAGGNDIDLEQLCPTGVASIESRKGAGDAIMTWLTGGLYSPMSVEVQCASGSAHLIDLESGEASAVARAGGPGADR